MPDQMSNTPQYKCKQCGKALNSEYELRDHENTHKTQTQQRSQGAGAGAQSKDRP